MSGILESCEKLFGSSSLYKVLAVDKTASENERECPYRIVEVKWGPGGGGGGRGRMALIKSL